MTEFSWNDTVRRAPMPWPATAPKTDTMEAKELCARCGADVWYILKNGEVCCADCEQIAPWLLQSHCG